MKFVIFGDSKGKKNGINKKVLIRLVKRIKKLDPLADYIIHLGDITAGNDNIDKLRSMFEEYKNILRCLDIKSIMLPVFGNHEEGENPSDYASEIVFSEVFKDFTTDGELEGYNGTVYFKDIDNTRLIVLNSCHFREENRISGEQLKWFRNVSAVTRDFKILFVHIPAYPSGAHFGTSMDLYPDIRDKFWSVIDENGIDIVFSGHEHNYSRRVINEGFSTENHKFNNRVYQIISGGGGEKLRDKYKSKAGIVVPPIAKNHFVEIEILGKGLVLKAYDLNDNLLDEFIIKKEQHT